MPHDTKAKRWSTLAACTVAVAATFGGSNPHAAEQQTLTQIQRYCQTSWRNAGIQEQEWEDCTQQVVSELLAAIPRDLETAVNVQQSTEHRELKRAVWRTIKRWQRRPGYRSYEDAELSSTHTQHNAESRQAALWEEVQTIAEHCLTPQQQQVIQWTRDGWTVGEIARRLGIPAERVSDAKYRAIGKLRERLA